MTVSSDVLRIQHWPGLAGGESVCQSVLHAFHPNTTVGRSSESLSCRHAQEQEREIWIEIVAMADKMVSCWTWKALRDLEEVSQLFMNTMTVDTGSWNYYNMGFSVPFCEPNF